MKGGWLVEIGGAALIGSLLGAGLVGAHGGDTSQIHSCQPAGQPLRQVDAHDTSCAQNQGASMDWAQRGSTGPAGARGPQGAIGPAGTPAPRYRLHVVSKAATGYSFKSETARCPSGELAVSGGWVGGSGANQSTRQGSDGWSVEGPDAESGLTKWGYSTAFSLTVYAVCAKAVP